MAKKIRPSENQLPPDSLDVELLRRVQGVWLDKLKSQGFSKQIQEEIEKEIDQNSDLASLWFNSISGDYFDLDSACEKTIHKLWQETYSIGNLYTEILNLKEAVIETVGSATELVNKSNQEWTEWTSHSFHVLDKLFAKCLNETSVIYESIFEQSSRGCCHVDLTGKILYANSTFRKLVGLDYVIGHQLIDFFTTGQQTIQNALQSQQDIVPVITRALLRKGSENIPVTAEFGPIIVEGFCTGGYSTITDISIFNAELQVYENSPLGIIKVDTDNYITYANKKALTSLNLPAEEINKRTFKSFFPEKDQKIIEQHLELRRQGEADEYDLNHLPDSRELPLHVIAIPEMDNRHNWTSTFVIIRALDDEFIHKLLRRIVESVEMGSYLSKITKERPISMQKPATVICEELTRFYKWDNVSIFKVLPDNKFELLAQNAEPRDGYRLPEMHTQAISEGLLGEALRRKRPLIENNVHNGPLADKYKEIRPETQSELVFPIEIMERVTWLLNIEDANLNAFCPEDFDTLNRIFSSGLRLVLGGVFARSLLEMTWDEERYGIIMTMEDYRIIDANRTAHEMLKMPPKSDLLIGRNLADFLGDTEREQIETPLNFGPEIIKLIDSRGLPFKMALSSRALPEYGRRVFFAEDPTILNIIEKQRQEREFETNLKAPIRLIRCEVHDVACFGTIDWPLQPRVNILLGRNGYGKTELLRMMAAVLVHDQDESAKFFRGPSSIRLTAVRRSFRGTGEQVRPEVIERTQSSESTQSSFTAASIGKAPVLALPDARFINRRQTTVAPSDEVYDLARDGALHFVNRGNYEGIISTLLYQCCIDYMNNDKSFDLPIFRLLQDVVRELTDVPFFFHAIEPVGEARFRIDIRTQGSDERPIPIQLASQGTLSVLAIFGIIFRFLQAVWQSVGPEDVTSQRGIVFIDEIDAHLHPRWQQKIIPLLSAKFPNVQFLCTAHSPLVAAGCLDGEVAVLRADGDRFRAVPIPHDFIGWDPMKIYNDVFEIEDEDESYRHYTALRPQRKELEQEQRGLDELESRTLEQEQRSEEIAETLYYIDKTERQQEVLLDIDRLRVENARLKREKEQLARDRNEEESGIL